MKLLSVLLPVALSAAPPVLNKLEPWGAQRGKAVTLTIAGQALTEGAKVITTLPGTFTPLTPSMGRLSYLVELKADAPVGLYPIRLDTPNGLSNVLLFSLGDFMEIDEADAAAIEQIPVTVNGTLKAAQIDSYKIHGKAGERRVIEVEARRIGSAIDPALRILDSAGKPLMRVDDTPGLGVDCRIDFTFPREGDYTVEIHDTRFSDQTVNFYRLKMGAYSYAGAMFPLGWKRGEAVEVELSGGNLAAPVKVKPEGAWVRFANSVGSMPLPFVLGERPESLEPAGEGPHALAPGTVLNGRIGKPGERDRYRFAVTAGKDYLVELGARGLGTSRLDGVITVYDAAGKRIDSAGDVPPKQSVFATIAAGDVASDPYLIFRAPRDAKEVQIAVEDIAGAGGAAYGYRLTAREQPPDFEISLATPYINVPAGSTATVSVNVERRGFEGPVQLSVANAGDDLEVSGGTVPGEIVLADGRGLSRRGVLAISAKPGAKARTTDLEIWGEAKLPDGSVIRRKALGPGMITPIRGTLGFVDPNRRNQNKPFTAPWLGLGLPARVVASESAGALEVAGPRRVRIVQGMRHDFAWTFASKTPGVRAPMAVTPDTPGALDLRLTDRAAGERKAGAGTLTMNTTIGTPASTFDVILSARAGAGMEEETLYAPAVTVEVVQGYYVDEPKQAADKLELIGQVRREAGFNMPVTIAPDALPLGITCQPAEAAGSEYRIACEAGPGAPAGEHKILLNPASILPEGEKGKVPYKIAPVEATLRIGK